MSAIERPIAWIKSGTCMICTSHLPDSYGYPRTVRQGRIATIARRILFRKYGKQPKSVVSRHTCDTRNCINPEHIIAGTAIQNTSDRHLRGRDARGEKNGVSKLRHSDVLEIRRLLSNKVPQKTIAKQFGVVQQTISNIKLGLNWYSYVDKLPSKPIK